MMTPQQIRLVRETFSHLAPVSDTAGQMFYARLFELDPKLHGLFKGPITDQGRLLFSMLELVSKTLDIQDKVVPVIHDLGRRHGAYGVHEHDYKVFGDALMWTLERVLGSEFTPQTREAWQSAYDFLADVMGDGSLADPAPRAKAG